MKYVELREECCAANLLLPQYGLVDLTFGNVSCLDRQAGVFAIKPSGVVFSRLSPKDVVVVDLNGEVVDGHCRPSSDTETHRCLYGAFLNVRAIAHTHSRHAVAFAQARRGIPCLGTTHADYFNGEVPVTREMTAEEITRGYEWETGRMIVERFQQLSPEEMPAVLVRSHGPFTWGENGTKAVEHALALEIVAEAALASLQLAPGIEPIPDTLLHKHFHRKHGPNQYYGQNT